MVKKINHVKNVENPKIFLTLIPNFTSTPDEVPLSHWISLLKKLSNNISLIGISKKHYPCDILYPFKYIKDLNKYSKGHYNPLQVEEISPEEIKTLVNNALKHLDTNNL